MLRNSMFNPSGPAAAARTSLVTEALLVRTTAVATLMHVMTAYDLDAFEQSFATAIKVKPGLQRIFAHLFLHCLDLLNHAVGVHR